MPEQLNEPIIYERIMYTQNALNADLLLIHQIVTTKEPGTRPGTFGFVAVLACKRNTQYMAFLKIEITMHDKLRAHTYKSNDLQQTFCVVSAIHWLSIKPQKQAKLRPDTKSEKQHFSVMNISWSPGPSSWVYTPM